MAGNRPAWKGYFTSSTPDAMAANNHPHDLVKHLAVRRDVIPRHISRSAAVDARLRDVREVEGAADAAQLRDILDEIWSDPHYEDEGIEPEDNPVADGHDADFAVERDHFADIEDLRGQFSRDERMRRARARRSRLLRQFGAESFARSQGGRKRPAKGMAAQDADPYGEFDPIPERYFSAEGAGGQGASGYWDPAAPRAYWDYQARTEAGRADYYHRLALFAASVNASTEEILAAARLWELHSERAAYAAAQLKKLDEEAERKKREEEDRKKKGGNRPRVQETHRRRRLSQSEKDEVSKAFLNFVGPAVDYGPDGPYRRLRASDRDAEQLLQALLDFVDPSSNPKLGQVERALRGSELRSKVREARFANPAINWGPEGPPEVITTQGGEGGPQPAPIAELAQARSITSEDLVNISSWRGYFR